MSERAGEASRYHDCPAGRHWGPRGAAGVLAWTQANGRVYVLLALRSHEVQHGGTWSTIGGAIDAGESPWQAAARELREEVEGIHPADGLITASWTEPCPAGCGWAYSTFMLQVPALVPVRVRPGRSSWETVTVAWVPLDRVAARRRLHPGLQAAWPRLARFIEAELAPWPALR